MKYSFGYEDADVVSALIDKRVLNPQHKAVLKMRFVEGLTYQEIADSPDVRINSFRQVGKVIASYAPKLKELLNN